MLVLLSNPKSDRPIPVWSACGGCHFEIDSDCPKAQDEDGDGPLLCVDSHFSCHKNYVWVDDGSGVLTGLLPPIDDISYVEHGKRPCKCPNCEKAFSEREEQLVLLRTKRLAQRDESRLSSRK
jgi:hypothetical protein